MRLLLSFFIILWITGCSQHIATPEKTSTPKEPKLISLNQFNTSFLFIAAQDAIATGDTVKAVRFLRVLVEKDPISIQPRMQLIELLLHHGAGSEALKNTEYLLSMELPKIQKDSLKQLQIRTLILVRRNQEAIQHATSFLHQDPKHIGIRTALVRLYIENSQFTKAMSTIQKGLNIEDNPKLRLLQVRIFIAQKKYSAAERSLLSLQKSQPKNPIIAILSSELAETMNQPVKAEKTLRKFLKQEPRDLSINHTLAKLLIRLKRPQEAIHLYQALQQEFGQDPSISSALGLIYYQNENYPNAEKNFQSALRQHESSRTRFYLAMTMEAQRKTNSAIKLYRQFKLSEVFYAKAQLRLASIFFEQNKLNESADILLNLVHNKPTFIEPYYLLFNIRSQQESYQQYIQESLPAIEKVAQPNIDILFNRAISFEKLKKHDAMEESLKAILKQNPQHTESLNFLGYSLAERDIRLHEAETLVQQALTLKPNDGYYLDSMAWIYYQQQQYPKALETQQKALTYVSDDPIMLEHLGDIFFKLQQRDQAHEAWNKALSLRHPTPQTIERKLQQ